MLIRVGALNRSFTVFLIFNPDLPYILHFCDTTGSVFSRQSVILKGAWDEISSIQISCLRGGDCGMHPLDTGLRSLPYPFP